MDMKGELNIAFILNAAQKKTQCSPLIIIISGMFAEGFFLGFYSANFSNLIC